MKSGVKNTQLKGIGLFVVLFLLMAMFFAIFVGKIISASIEYNLENPYHFEKVIGTIVRIEKYESPHNFMDFYVCYAQYEDEETGTFYETLYYGNEHYNEAEAEAQIGKNVYMLIDREYGKAISYSENAEKGGAPIDIIVYSVLLAFCSAIMILSIIKIAKKNKKHLIWMSVVILLALLFAAYVAYASLDLNYIKQLKNLQ